MSARLAAATVAIRGDRITLRYTVEGDLPTGPGHHWLLSTTFVAGPDGPIQQLGFKEVDGTLASVFSFDHVEVGQLAYVASPQRIGKVWTVIFPTSALEDMTSGTWTAALDVNGFDAGTVDGSFSEVS